MTISMSACVGEFGVVYRGNLTGREQSLIAIKTLKGMQKVKDGTIATTKQCGSKMISM